MATSSAPSSSSSSSSSSTVAAVKYDYESERWITDDPEAEGPPAGYGIWGTLLRGGPKPFLTRLVAPDTYDQAVLKFMAGENGSSSKNKKNNKKEASGPAGAGVDRATAQANVDAFLENAQDWAYNRMQGYDVDYLTVKQKDVVLRILWSSVVAALAARAAAACAAGENFWDFLA